MAAESLDMKGKQLGISIKAETQGADHRSVRKIKMAVMALTMRAKQPKRGVIAGEKGFIEINDYPRAQKASITYTQDGHTEVIEEGNSKLALQYEVQDMQDYVRNQGGTENFKIVCDVMDTLTTVRSQWGMVYPFE